MSSTPTLVEFHCPTHGKVLEAQPHAAVLCGKCGGDCAPEGEDPKAHLKDYFNRQRQRRFAARRRS